MPRVPELVNGRAEIQSNQFQPPNPFSATAPEGTLLQPHKVHLKSLSSLVSREGIGNFALEVNLPPEKVRVIAKLIDLTEDLKESFP